ncbi:hypothetical protein NESM_000443300 [Novymonas esmeraldas]|uniref:Uncharacterized protein n=1 Tax=Novymonas esmeraldas TaxID=1808958 RepID=A0AAW0ENS0_9TRYP
MFAQRDDGPVGAASPAMDGGPAVAAGSRKRGRDIRGLPRFRSVVYGEDGVRRLHAMVARNAVLMYPPDGIAEARARVEARRAALQCGATAEPRRQHKGDEDEDDDMFAFFERRRCAETDVLGADATEAEAEVDASRSATHSPTAPARSLAAAAACRDEQLATHHHQQLDAYLRVLYEFNHVTFVKLPMDDTLQLLSRCGKEAVAHTIEYETQARLRRQSRIRELVELRQEQAELEERRRAVEQAEHVRLVEAAERHQAELDVDGDDDVVKPENRVDWAVGGVAAAPYSIPPLPSSSDVED